MKISLYLGGFTIAGLITGILVSCGGTGDLEKDLGSVTANYVVLDLVTLKEQPKESVPDLVSNPEYKDRYLVFKEVTSGSTIVGTATSGFGLQSDETRATTSTGRYLISVFEITQAQWTRLAGTSPWLTLPSSLAGVVGADKSAIGVSANNVSSMLTAYANGSYHLRLPTAVEWERACRSGSGATYAWGEALDEVTVSVHAIVNETAGGVVGPRVVGTRAANAYGLYDMHGNVWELTSDGDIRGGSWRDSLPSARAANKMTIDEGTAHPLVGLRLVLEFQ